jgi:DNA-binding FadR family transcriptional regulator
MDRFAASHGVDAVVSDIEEQILNGRLQPRDRLPTEDELASLHGVSRTAVRQALSRLRERGYLHTVKGSGSYVRRADWCSATLAWTLPRHELPQRAS